MADDAMTEAVRMTPRDPIDIAERIVRLETKLDFIIAQIDKLPPSPACVAKHNEFDARFEALEAWRNRAIGVFMVTNILFILFLDKIKGFFTSP
jgi:hypothetical protein